MHEVKITDNITVDPVFLRIELSEEQLKLLAEMIAQKIMETNQCMK